MTEKERNELDEILTNDPLLACDVIDEKSNYQYTVKIIKWTWGDRYSVCINDKIGQALVDSPLMDEDTARGFYDHVVSLTASPEHKDAICQQVASLTIINHLKHYGL